MPIIKIDDANDSRVQHFANLRGDVVRELDRESFVAEGRWCVQRLISSPYRLLSLLVERSKEAEFAEWVSSDIPIYSLPSEQVNTLVGYKFHRGVLACGQRQPLLPSATLAFPRDCVPLALALFGVSEHENVGSMIRTAAALGIENLIIGPQTADPFSRRVIRVSMATVFCQRLYWMDRPAAELAQLARSGEIRTMVTTLDADATPLDQLQMDDRPGILVVGNEAQGVSPEIQDLATDRVMIPMRLGVDSLNVAVAAAIFMYQLVRRLPP